MPSMAETDTEGGVSRELEEEEESDMSINDDWTAGEDEERELVDEEAPESRKLCCECWMPAEKDEEEVFNPVPVPVPVPGFGLELV